MNSYPSSRLRLFLLIIASALFADRLSAQVRVDGSNLGTNVDHNVFVSGAITSNVYTSVGQVGGPFSTLNLAGFAWAPSLTTNGSLDLVNGAINLNAGSLVTHGYVGIGKYQSSASRIQLSNGANFVATGYVGVGVDNNDNFFNHLLVQSGSSYANYFGTTIGENTGSSGVLSVTGVGSTAATYNYLNVGYRGNGLLRIRDGATVTHAGTASSFLVGVLSGSFGQVSINGSGSKFATQNHAEIGGSGHGLLTITNGGEFIAQKYLAIGQNAGGLGEASITSGGKLTVGEELHLGEGNGGYSSGGLSVDGAGSVVQARSIVVGQWGSGALVVQNGGQVLVDGAAGYKHLTLGGEAGSIGALSIKGTDSRVQVNGDALIGRGGNGVVLIEQGGLLDVSGKAVIGELAGSSGTVTVTGAGSALNVGGAYMSVGLYGTGALNLINGGKLNSTVDFLGVGQEAGGQGAINISGAGSMLTAKSVNLGLRGVSGTMTVSDGGEAHLSEWLSVHGEGHSQLDITSGGKVEAGFNAGIGGASHGLINVSGAGSSLTAHDDIVVGWEGSGSLNVSQGALARADRHVLIGVSHDGDAAIASGGTLSAGQSILLGSVWGDGPAGHGTLTVTGAGSTASAPTTVVGVNGTGTLNLLNQGTLNTSTLAVDHGNVLVDGGNLNATSLTIGTDGALAFNRTGTAAGSINTTSIENAGQFKVNTAAPVSGTPDTRTIGGSLHNAATGNVAVNLQDNAQVTFTGPVTNDGTFKVTQAVGTSGGVTTFTDTFVNNGTFSQDPTTTHFADLFNTGYFSAGEGDQILVDGAFHNDGHLNLTRSLLSTGDGLINNGFIDIFGGAELFGDYSGLGSLIFHISNASDQLVIRDGFSGSLQLVFDPSFSLLGTENFLFFGHGAYLSSLMIGGVDFGALDFSGRGYLTGNGSFVAGSVPDAASTLGLLGVTLGGLAALRRRRAFLS